MTTPITGRVGADVDRAAGLLLAAARSGDDALDAGVPLQCLLAADELAAAGAIPTRIRVAADASAVAEAIRTALSLLAALPADVFAEDLISDAAADARDALTFLG
jgi:hypothetical protein